MGLKDRKFILNGGMNLPHFDEGVEPLPGTMVYGHGEGYQKAVEKAQEKIKADEKASKLNAVGDKVMGGALAAMGAVQMMAQFKDASQTSLTPEQMMRSGSTGSVDGEQFLRITVDSDAAMKQEEAARTANTMAMATTGMSTGAAIGSFAGPIGGAIGSVVGGAAGLIGGIFAGNRRKRLAEEAKRKAILQAANTNEKRFDIAYTNALRKQQAQKYGDDDSQELYHGWKGLEPSVNPFTKQTFDKFKVDTNHGMSFDTANGYGKKGEWIWNKFNLNLHKIQRGPNDNAKLHLASNDVIFTDDIINPFTGKSFAKSVPQAAKEGWLPTLLNQQIMTKEQLGFYKNVSNDRLQHSKFGWDTVGKALTGLGEALPTALNIFLGIKQIQASKDDTATPKSYVAPNTSKYQNDLDSLDINMYPIYQANRDASSISNTKIAQSGGLSAGQQMLGYLTNAMNERDADAKALTQAQIQRNAYKAEAAKVGINTELLRASLQQAANQWDYQQEAAAHNAKILNEQMGWYNISNAVQNFFKNRWEKNQFDKMYKIYAADVESRKPQTNADDSTPTNWMELDKESIKPLSTGSIVKTELDRTPAPKMPNKVSLDFNSIPTQYVARQNYKFGSTGDDVKLIQQKLGINDDGKYGSDTKRNVRLWQKAHGLKPDGVVGPLTWAKLVGTPWYIAKYN